MYSEMLRLDERVAVVIGAGGGGIGTHTSLALAEAGAIVAAVDVVEERVRDTERRIRSGGGKCVGYVVDARDASAVGKILDEIWRELGPIRHSVNVVGGSFPVHHRAEEYSDELFEDVLSLNLKTQFQSSREVAKRMIQHGVGGSIVNFSSVAGTHGAPYQVAYSSAKAAILAMTRTMAVEWGPKNIRINAVVPGGVRTPRIMARAGQAARVGTVFDLATWAPLGRLCEPEEVAAAALFLISDLSRMITGQYLIVDGGVTTRPPFGDVAAPLTLSAEAQRPAACGGTEDVYPLPS